MKTFHAVIALLMSLFLFVSCTKKVDDKDNTFYAIVKSNIRTLDPVNTTDLYSAEVIANMFETLLHYNYLKRPLELEPLLAAEMPSVSKDGLTYTIKIRQGVKFHDDPAFPNGEGRELVAEDFVYSWKRMADPANKSESFWLLDEKIKGLNDWRDKITKGQVTYDTPIEGLTAPDKYTLVIKLTRPYYQLNYALAMPQMAPVAKEAIAKYGAESINHPVGTGPYKFESWVRNSKVVMVRNPKWHGAITYPTQGEEADKQRGMLADAGAKLPFADRVEVHEIVEDQPRWLSMMKGDLDYIEIPKDNFAVAVKDGKESDEMVKKKIHLYIAPEPDLTYTGINALDPILGKNADLRRAMMLATDTKTLIERFYNNSAIPAQSPIPPGIDGYDPAFKNPYREFDVAKAKEFMKKAGYPEGKGLPELEYSIPNGSTYRQIAEFFQQNMEKIGIKIRITVNTWPQFMDKLKSKKAQLWGVAWVADYPDAENFLQLYYGKNVSPGPNDANYKNAEYDKLYEKAAKLPPGAERTKVYQQMRDIYVNDLPTLAETHRLGRRIYHDWVSNFKYHPTVLDFYKYVKIDPKKRAEQKAKL